MFTIGTAGHIDHGKSSLVKALTSIDPDRLPEEKSRGMTIDLGFAWMELPSYAMVGIIDVPGHKQFVNNVIPGFFGVDAALLVIAADDGWMPQTEEHLHILDLIGVKHGLVVLNKMDLAPNTEWLELVEKDVASHLTGTSLAHAPIIRVSTRSGEGISKLKQAIATLAKKLDVRKDIGKPRLPIDRVFVVKGSGTVVTGTLSQGTFQTGDSVSIIPSGLNARIRNMESFKISTGKGIPGGRIALNLTGIRHTDIKRGHIVVAAHHNPSLSRFLDTQLTLLTSIETPLQNMAEVLVYLETHEILGRMFFIGSKVMAPGESALVQLRFQEDVSAFIGERFIIRQQSPSITIGGGVVLDPQANKLKLADIPTRTTFLQQRLSLGLDELILSEISKKYWVKIQQLLSNSIYSTREIATRVRQLADKKLLIIAADYAVQPTVWQNRCQQLLLDIDATHKADPLQTGTPQATIKEVSELPCEIFDVIVQQLIVTGKLMRHDDMLCLPNNKPTISPQQELLKQNILNMFATQTTAPPTLSEIGKRMTNSLPVVYYLIKQGFLIDLGEGVLMNKTQFEHIREEIVLMLKQNGQISIQNINQRFGFSRKYSVPLLTYLDRIGITRREGDVRISGKQLT